MLVIAIDTSTPAVLAGVVSMNSVTEGNPDIAVLARKTTFDAKAHAEVLTPHILECLVDAGFKTSDVDAVVVGTGPGPYAGLRVGMATAAAFGDALSTPVYGVCSLDAMAADIEHRGDSNPSMPIGSARELLVVTDARRREVYWARYSGGVRVAGPNVTAVGDVDVSGANCVAGSPQHALLLGLPVVDVASPSPMGLVVAARHELTLGSEPLLLVPLYLRRPDASTLEERAATKAAAALAKSDR